MATKKSPEDHLRMGVELQKAGDLKGATIELKNALQAAPDNAEARFLLGQTYFTAGNFQSAEKELSKARGLGIKNEALLPLLARTLIALHQPQRVLDEIKEIDGATAENNAAILALRAQAQIILKNTAAAEQNMAAADARFPDHPETLIARANLAFAQGQKANALSLVEKALTKAGQRADLWILKGYLLRSAGQRDEALTAYAKALNFEPENIPARLASAELHLEASALDKAEADIKQLRKQAPANPIGPYLEAMLDFRHAKYVQADEKLQGVLRVAPDMLRAHLLSGAVNLALGKREEAKSHLNRVLAAAPEHPLARKLMAATLADMGDVDQAKKILSGFDAAGDDPILHALKGEIALHQGDYGEARKQLENMGANTPQNAKYFTDLAASRMGSGDEGGAVQALTKAAELDTQSTTPDILLVLAHLKEKRFDEAMKVVDKLTKEHPNDPLNDNLRGAIYLAQQNKTQARTSFTKALQTNPGYFPAASNLAALDMADKDIKAARGRFEQILKHAPKESRAWLALAAFDARDKNEAAYLHDLEQGKQASGKNAQVHQLLIRYWLDKKDAGKALAAAQEALTATGRSDFQEYIGMALALQGDNVSALASFKHWAETNPKNPLAHFRVAQAQIAAKDNNAALAALDKALALRADFAEASASKALLLGQMGRPAEAIKIARGLQTRFPKAAAGYLTEAEILFGDKKFLDAGKLFAKAAELTGQGQPLTRAYQAYAAAGKAAEGEKLLGQWLTAHPNDLMVRHTLAQAQLDNKRLHESAENYRILARANPRDLRALNNLSWILGELKDPGAVPAAEQAYKLAPDNPSVLDTYAWQLNLNGQSARALPLLNAALKSQPANAEIRWHMAATLARSGNKIDAIAELDRLLASQAVFPQRAQAQILLTQLRHN
jgi:putative PEP-CTERM system TPR-repeat lipoprotein